MQVWYPYAVRRPLQSHSEPGTLEQRDRIVLHVTEGADAAGALAWWPQTKTPNRTSAHFVIDRNGTIYQCVPVNDTAWHASGFNRRSVGIEHAGITEEGAKRLHVLPKPCTDEQYSASAMLVAWLADLLKIPIDRQHVLEHCEASPADGHPLCCHGALNPDRVVTFAQQIQKTT